MADRNDPNSFWVPTTIFDEIHLDTKDANPSLTEDELNIIWTTREIGGEHRTYTASRSSITESFSNVSEASQLTEMGASSPYFSPDGLMVYFTILNDDSVFELWTGVRASLDEPFGDFLPMDAINQPGIHFSSPCISPDGSVLYFVKGGPDMEQMDKGIYVSYWVETPYEAAMRNLEEATEAKRQARLLLDEAVEKEIAAIKALREVDSEDLPDGVTKKQLRRARIAIYQALQRQFIARKNICQALDYLAKALEVLDATWVEETCENDGQGESRSRENLSEKLKSNNASSIKQNQRKN